MVLSLVVFTLNIPSLLALSFWSPSTPGGNISSANCTIYYVSLVFVWLNSCCWKHWEWTRACMLTVYLLCFCSWGREQAGLGVRSRPGEAGHGPVQHPRHSAVLESGRTLPQTVQSAGHPPAHLLSGTNTHTKPNVQHKDCDRSLQLSGKR